MADGTVESSDYDICFSSKEMNEQQMLQYYEQMRGVTGITESSYQGDLIADCTVKKSELTKAAENELRNSSENEEVRIPVLIQYLDDNSFCNILKRFHFNQVEYMGDNAKILGIAQVEVKADNKSKEVDFWDVFLKKEIDLELEGKSDEFTKPLTVTLTDKPVMDSIMPGPCSMEHVCFYLFIPYSHRGNVKFDCMGLTFRSQNTSQSMYEFRSILEENKISFNYTLLNMREILEFNRNIIFVVDIFTYVFVAMISLIAIANVFNTISTNIKLRRRELSMLRSVGMSDSSFHKMMNLECVFYGTRTLLIGLPISALFSYLIFYGMNLGGFEGNYYFPYQSMIVSILGVFTIVFITMLYSIKKIKKENIIDILRDDME